MSFSIKKILNKINIEIIILFMLVLIFFSYMIPMLYAYLSSNLFIYVNAWDEETYLTYQAALGLSTRPSHFTASLFTLFFQKIGISGSIQNLVFDFILIPIITILLYKILLKFKINHFYAFVFSIIILFSSVLFNYSNPWLVEIFPIRNIQFMMFGYESYASILRTPNPQLSYLLVSIAIYIFQKKHKDIILFLPLPFLYFYVAIPYFYFLIIYLYLKFFNKNINFINTLKSSLLAYIVIALGMILMNKFILQNTIIVARSKEFYFETHEIFIPLVSIVSIIFSIIQFIIYIKKEKYFLLKLLYLQIYLLLGIFFIANLQLICGYLLAYKNYYDYSFSILIGISISIFIYSLSQSYKHRKIVYFSILIFILPMIYMNFTSQGFNFSKMQYKIYMGGNISKNTLNQIIKNPTHALIDSLDFRSKVAYGIPKIVIPPFSYQYNYPFIEKQCVYNKILYNNAISNIMEKHPKYLKYFEDSYTEYTNNIHKFKYIYLNKTIYCNHPLYMNHDFFLTRVNNQKIWHYFPQ